MYHPYHVWEDFVNGMWRKVDKKEEMVFLKESIEFTSDSTLYGLYMIWVIKVWPFGCEHNLSCISMNRQAWIGQSAVCMAIGSPEYITRLAWHQLTKDQQDKANVKADEAIKIWEENYAKDKNWNRCSNGCEAPDFMDVRYIRESLPFFQRGERQHGNVASSSRGSQKKEKKIRPIVDRFGRAIQVDYRSCGRLF